MTDVGHHKRYLKAKDKAMTHYVLIDQDSGFVWGEADASDPIAACTIVDKQISPGIDREYEIVPRLDGRSGYHVFEAPAGWTEVDDGQSTAEINRVQALPMVASVSFKTQSDWTQSD